MQTNQALTTNLTKSQIDMVADFKSMTSASTAQAIRFLTQSKWNIQAAVNNFYDKGEAPEEEPSGETPYLNDLFVKFSEQGPQGRVMDEEKFSEFIAKCMPVDQTSPVVGHILINIMGVQSSGKIYKDNFCKLFMHLNCKTEKQLPKAIPRLQQQIQNKQTYKNLYIGLYKFYLLGKQLSLPFDIASQLWQLYLPSLMPTLYPQFRKYLQTTKKAPERVHQDLWKMVYEFAVGVKDIKDVNEGDGWPVFIDEFVEECKHAK